MRKEHIHHPLDEEVRFISGYYLLSEELRLPHRGREVLVILGHAVLDTACCGTTGCGYALVPGTIRKWKFRKNSEGLAVSEVSPIRDDGMKKEIETMVRKQHMIQQIIFV